MSDEQLEAYKAFLAAKAYQSYVIQRRASKNITATLKAVSYTHLTLPTKVKV